MNTRTFIINTLNKEVMDNSRIDHTDAESMVVGVAWCELCDFHKHMRIMEDNGMHFSGDAEYNNITVNLFVMDRKRIEAKGNTYLPAKLLLNADVHDDVDLLDNKEFRDFCYKELDATFADDTMSIDAHYLRVADEMHDVLYNEQVNVEDVANTFYEVLSAGAILYFRPLDSDEKVIKVNGRSYELLPVYLSEGCKVWDPVHFKLPMGIEAYVRLLGDETLNGVKFDVTKTIMTCDMLRALKDSCDKNLLYSLLQDSIIYQQSAEVK